MGQAELHKNKLETEYRTWDFKYCKDVSLTL